MEESLAMVTVNGARAIGLEGRAGILAPGVRADFLVFDLPPGMEKQRLAAGIVESGRPAAVMMAGRQVC
jgi:imidazolonepropionase-like amidohydrolase